MWATSWLQGTGVPATLPSTAHDFPGWSTMLNELKNKVQKTGAWDPALRPIVRERQFSRAKLEAQIVVRIVSKTTNKISRDS